MTVYQKMLQIGEQQGLWLGMQQEAAKIALTMLRRGLPFGAYQSTYRSFSDQAEGPAAAAKIVMSLGQSCKQAVHRPWQQKTEKRL